MVSLSKAQEQQFPYQTDPAFSEAHNEEGCYFQAIARVAWEEGGLRDDDLREGINRRAELCKEADYIGERFTVYVPEAVFLVFGLVAEFTDKWERPEREYRIGERHILRMAYKGMRHFVVGKKGNKVAWDPWGPDGSLTAKHGKVVDKRVFIIKGRVGRVGGRYNG